MENKDRLTANNLKFFYPCKNAQKKYLQTNAYYKTKQNKLFFLF